jgi:hypothetical protein
VRNCAYSRCLELTLHPWGQPAFVSRPKVCLHTFLRASPAYLMPLLSRSMQPSCHNAAATAKSASATGWRLACASMSRQARGCLSSGQKSTAQPADGRLQVVSLSGRGIQARSCISKSVGRSHLRQPFTAAAARNRAARPPSAVSELIASLAASPYRDYYVLSCAGLGAVVWVKVFDLLAANGTLEQVRRRGFATRLAT